MIWSIAHSSVDGDCEDSDKRIIGLNKMVACSFAVMQIGLIQIVRINDLTDERCRKEQPIGYGPRMR